MDPIAKHVFGNGLTRPLLDSSSAARNTNGVYNPALEPCQSVSAANAILVRPVREPKPGHLAELFRKRVTTAVTMPVRASSHDRIERRHPTDRVETTMKRHFAIKLIGLNVRPFLFCRFIARYLLLFDFSDFRKWPVSSHIQLSLPRPRGNLSKPKKDNFAASEWIYIQEASGSEGRDWEKGSVILMSTSGHQEIGNLTKKLDKNRSCTFVWISAEEPPSKPWILDKGSIAKPALGGDAIERRRAVAARLGEEYRGSGMISPAEKS